MSKEQKDPKGSNKTLAILREQAASHRARIDEIQASIDETKPLYEALRNERKLLVVVEGYIAQLSGVEPEATPNGRRGRGSVPPQVLDFLRKAGKASSVSEIAAALGIHAGTVRYSLVGLMRDGQVRGQGKLWVAV